MKVYSETMVIFKLAGNTGLDISLTVKELKTIWNALYDSRAEDYRADTDQQIIEDKYDVLMDKIDIDKIFQRINNGGK